ncbi:cation:proton antiporter [bacterium]|nr:cation:proton antiporter [bacterium]
MIQRVFVLFMLVGVMSLITYTTILGQHQDLSPTLVLGFLLLAAYCVGQILEKIKLPKLSGYMIAGLAFGPYCMNFVSKEVIFDLSFINNLALAFIAFCAGGELKSSQLKNQIRSIKNLVIIQTIFVFLSVSTVMFFLIEFIPAFVNIGYAKRLAISVIFGIISVALSPSSTIAIISETKAKGKYTDIMLSVTVIIDVIVIVLFGVAVSFSKAIFSSTASMDWTFFLILLVEIILALILGSFLGKGIVFLIDKVKVEFPVVIVGVGFFVIKFSHLSTAYLHDSHDIVINFEPLLICIAAGFTVQNYSNFGKNFLYKMDRVSLPVFIAFFAITGASINIDILKTSWIFGLIIVGIRLVTLYIACITSGIISKDESLIYKNYWLGSITQAGVSLGLLAEIIRSFPSIGEPIQSLLIAAIAVNQFIGPVALKWALVKVGDAKNE